jgi:hypothetical protein
VNASLVNWLPWSLLKIAGTPHTLKASSSTDTQNAASSVFDTRQARTFRLYQSIIQARYTWLPLTLI